MTQIEPCIFCGAECTTMHIDDMQGVTQWWIGHDGDCDCHETEQEAIAAHNHLCRRVRAGRAAEELVLNPPQVIGEYGATYDSGREAGIALCIDRLKAALEGDDE